MVLQEKVTNHYLKSVFFIDSLKGWACGWNYTILYTDNGGNEITSIGDNLPDITKKTFQKSILKQNYPNPFKSRTVISYQLPQDCSVSIKVYNLSGREVADLVNRKQRKGVYKVFFHASNLSGGSYIYQLIAGNRVENKMMVLLP